MSLSTISYPLVSARGVLGGPDAAFTDPFANVVFIGATDIHPSVLLEQLANGGFPIDTLGAFLHEGTHHRCFDSPVGLSLLGIEGFSRAAWWQTLQCREDASCAQQPVCANRALIREILALFTPLAEGLALYAELDALPGNAASASQTLLNALSVYFEGQMADFARRRQSPYAAFETLLRHERHSTHATFARTRELLASSDAEVLAYQQGYAWVTSVARSLQERSNVAASDTDVLAAFLCSFFFDDYELARMISGASWSVEYGAPILHAGAIYEYLEARVQLLRTPQAVAWLQEYAGRLARGTARSSSFVTPTTAANERMRSVQQQALVGELYWAAPKATAARRFFRFGTFRADALQIDVEREHVACSVGDRVIALPLLPRGAPVGTGQVSYDASETAIELLIVNYHVVICYFGRGSLLAATDRRMQPLRADVAEQALGWTAPYTHAEAWRLRHWELLHPAPDTACAKYLQARLAAASHATQAIYQVSSM